MRKYKIYPFELIYGVDPRRFTNCLTSMNEMRNWQGFAHKKGIALKKHIDDAHNGKKDKNCPACKELISKLEKT